MMPLQAYVWAALLLPVWAVLMWYPVSPTTTTSTTTAMTIPEVGLLYGGTLGALGAAATERYVDDLVGVHRRGLVRGPGAMHAADRAAERAGRGRARRQRRQLRCSWRIRRRSRSQPGE